MRRTRAEAPCSPIGHAPTRRELLMGAAAAAIVVATPKVLAKTQERDARAPQPLRPSKAALRRYMAASAVLPDGRVLVAGGYDRPWRAQSSPTPLSSAAIYDPSRDVWYNAASMNSPRARHAAVTLSDGRVAVLGGMGFQALSSVEIYDPSTNSWSMGQALSQPRFDHSAVSSGGDVFVLGGSGLSIVSSVEVIRPEEVAASSI